MVEAITIQDETQALPTLSNEYVIACAGKLLDLRTPQVMGVLNVTPDSFSDGGYFLSPDLAITRAIDMLEEGAAVIDVGGESTRPGADPVSVDEELARVMPVIEVLSRELPIPVSIDTYKPEVMRQAVEAGAGMINDVFALQEGDALQTAARLDVPVCLMHMLGRPRTMQQAPRYQDVVAEVKSFLKERLDRSMEAGIPRNRLLIDPGFGFGKTLQHNLLLLKDLRELTTLGVPLVAGLSRKSMIGKILDVPVDERVYGSIAAATLAAWQGARLIRVHDVRETQDALRLVRAVSEVDGLS